MGIFEDELSDIKEKLKTVYHPPLPKKIQRTVHHRGRSGKCKCYTPEQLLVANMKRAAKALGRKTY